MPAKAKEETPEVQPAKNIYEALNRVMQKVGYVQKEKNRNLRYTFASEAAMIEAVRPHMVAEGIVVHVTTINEVATEQFKTSKGYPMNRTTTQIVFRFHHVASGTEIDVPAIGEGMDTGDKSSPKSMTIALKYALRQTLMIETGDDPDKDPSENYIREIDDEDEEEQTDRRSRRKRSNNGNTRRRKERVRQEEPEEDDEEEDEEENEEENADDELTAKAKQYKVPNDLPGGGATLGELLEDKDVGRVVLGWLAGTLPNENWEKEPGVKGDPIFLPKGNDEKKLGAAAEYLWEMFFAEEEEDDEEPVYEDV
jgi:hypothetical protein